MEAGADDRVLAALAELALGTCTWQRLLDRDEAQDLLLPDEYGTLTRADLDRRERMLALESERSVWARLARAHRRAGGLPESAVEEPEA